LHCCGKKRQHCSVGDEATTIETCPEEKKKKSSITDSNKVNYGPLF